MHRRGLVATLAAAIPWIASPAWALFHFAHVSEVHTMLDGDGGAQYVEIIMDAPSQTFVSNSVLHAWDCAGASLGDLLIVPSNLANGGKDVKWIMATTSPIGGITPDFVIPSAGLPASCGQVCWGAPGLAPPDPGTWDHTDPANYVDCVAYGGYTGTTKASSGTPTPLAPTAAFSLTRVSDTDDNAADFALDCPTPENDAGMVGGPAGPCTTPTTTTTLATTSTTIPGSTTTTIVGSTTTTIATTSTTIPGSTTTTTIGTTSTTIVGSTTTTTMPTGTIDQPLDGTKLLLKAKPGKPEKSKLVLVAKDRSLSIGAGPGSSEDPTTGGGSLRIASGSPGGSFVGTHRLTGEWKPIGKPEAAKGWKWKSKTSPVRLVLVKDGKLLKVKAKGDIGFDLDDDLDPVTVEVTIGSRRYCLEFGGAAPKFTEGRKYLAKKPDAPGACP